jgi:acetylornithine deacetylase/succinyl-diaminopimelate desuccinylase-like protein
MMPLDLQLSKALAQVENDLDAHVCEVQRFVRQPSVSATGEGIPEMADIVRSKIQSLGADCELVSTGRHPIVYGRLDAGAERTVVFYELYDVQPATESGWVVPPFSGEVVELPDRGRCIVGRGTFNSKGCLAGFLNCLDAIRASGSRPPVNVIFIVEGEEEIGSPSLPGFVRDRREELQKADCVFQPYFGENAAGTTILYLGFKGMVCLELTCTGGEWGGPVTRDIHAMHAAWIANPAWRLVQALATMQSSGDAAETTTVAGLARGVRPPTPEEKMLLDALTTSFDERVILEEQGNARCFKWSELEGVDLLEKYLYEPSLNLNGIAAGYTGAGAVIPREARARLDIRLVPDMEPDEVIESVRSHLKANDYGDIRVDVLQSYPPSQGSVSQGPVDALVRSAKDYAPGPVQVWPRSAGAAPHYVFTRQLGIPLAFGGLGHGGRSHSANEYITVEGLRRHERGIIGFLYALASMSQKE